MRRGRLRLPEAVSRLALVGFGTMASLLFAEAAVHAVEWARGPIFPGGARTLSFSLPDPLLGWRHEPDFSQRYGWPEHPDGYITIATNNLGLREDGPSGEVPEPGVLRVLALGDSHTDGLLNNDESWPNVLEKLGEAEHGPWEVLNAGVTGYQPWHYYTWWQQYGRVLRPDLVLLAYYLGNDLPSGGSFTDSESTTDALSEEGPGDAASAETSTLVRLARGLRHRCRLCALASLIGHRLVLDGPTYEESLFVAGADEEQQERYLAAVRYCIGCLWQSIEQQWRLDGSEAAYAEELGMTREIFLRLRDEVWSDGATLGVILLPTKMQIEPEALARARETARILGMQDVDTALEDRLRIDLRSLLLELEIPAIDVQDALETERAETGNKLYYDADWHLTPAGSRVVAEAVREALLTLGLLEHTR